MVRNAESMREADKRKVKYWCLSESPIEETNCVLVLVAMGTLCDFLPVGLSGLANENTRPPPKFEFQVNSG